MVKYRFHRISREINKTYTIYVTDDDREDEYLGMVRRDPASWQWQGFTFGDEAVTDGEYKNKRKAAVALDDLLKSVESHERD